MRMKISKQLTKLMSSNREHITPTDDKKEKGIFSYEDRMPNEPPLLQVCYLLAFLAAVGIYGFLGFAYSMLSSNALSIGEDYEGASYLMAGVQTDSASAYDTCQIPNFILDPSVSKDKLQDLETQILQNCGDGENQDPSSDCGLGTRWSLAFSINAALNVVTALNFLVMSCGAFVFSARYYTTFINYLLGGC